MRRMPRLIDDQRRKTSVLLLLAFMLAAVVALGCLKAFFFMNEQWKSDGEKVLNDLQEINGWFSERMNPVEDANALKIQLAEIDGYYLKKTSAISQADIEFIQSTRERQSQKRAGQLARKFQKQLSECSELKEKLSRMSTEGENLLGLMDGLAGSPTAQEIRNVCSRIEQCRSNLNQICNRNIAVGVDFWDAKIECKNIIELVKSNRTSDQGWGQFEKAHDDYVDWTEAVQKLQNKYNQLDKELQETYQNLKAISLDRENARELVYRKINEELTSTMSLHATGTEICDHFDMHFDEELEKMQLQAQKGVDTIAKWKEQHGDYVETAHVTFSRAALQSFKEFRLSAYDSAQEQCRIVQRSLSKATYAKAKAKTMLDFFQAFDADVSEEQFLQKCKEGMNCVSELQSSREELRKELDLLQKHVSQTQSSAKEKVDEITNLVHKIEESFPVWSVEGNVIAKDFSDIQQQIGNAKGKFANMKRDFMFYRDSGGQAEKASLQAVFGHIQEMLTEIDQLCSSQKYCYTGKELMELKKKWNRTKDLLDNVVQKNRELADKCAAYLKFGVLRKIDYVPYSNSLASLLQSGTRHLELALAMEAGGYHIVEIKFKQNGKSLFKTSPHIAHRVFVTCNVSGVQKNTREWNWNDYATSYWKGNIVLEGDFYAGLNDINLDFAFWAEDERKHVFRNGQWQFQYKGVFDSAMQDNLFVEFFVDGKPGKVLICKDKPGTLPRADLFNLGYSFDNGQNVIQDYAEAAKWYRRAADNGNAAAQNNLGVLYANGDGVARDYAEAVRWYRKAAEQGNSRARSNLGWCYENGRGVTQDYKQALEWYRMSADQGDSQGQNNLGRLYEDGRGVIQDYTEAVKWYRKAADQGHAWAQNNLGRLYENGRGVTQDYTEAVKWYRKAADQGHAWAQNNLGTLYENGRGVIRDYAEAAKWYRKAADQKIESAKEDLERLERTGKLNHGAKQ